MLCLERNKLRSYITEQQAVANSMPLVRKPIDFEGQSQWVCPSKSMRLMLQRYPVFSRSQNR